MDATTVVSPSPLLSAVQQIRPIPVYVTTVPGLDRPFVTGWLGPAFLFAAREGMYAPPHARAMYEQIPLGALYTICVEAGADPRHPESHPLFWKPFLRENIPPGLRLPPAHEDLARLLLNL